MSAAFPRKIVSVNTADTGGGAERIAWTLFKGYQRRGLESWLVVGDKRTDDPHVMPFFSSPHIDYRAYALPAYQRRLNRRRRRDLRRGREDFNHPYSAHLLQMTGGRRPDVVQCHNLHGGYFDLHALAAISQEVPVIVKLADRWLTTGHCVHPFDCTGWSRGCHKCPYLDIPEKINRDAARYNWRRKRRIYERARLFVCAPSRWMLDHARRSILDRAICDSRLIRNGIDLSVFRPANQQTGRRELGLPANALLALFVGNGTKTNPFKDYDTMLRAVAKIAAEWNDSQPIWFLAIGEAGDDVKAGNAIVRHLGFQASPLRLAKYYQSADVYLHAAKQENYPVAILEAMACGTPVVASRVGGIPEQIDDGVDGFLVEAGSSEGLADRMRRLLADDGLRRRIGERAHRRVVQTNCQEVMIDAYLDWCSEILETANHHQPGRESSTTRTE